MLVTSLEAAQIGLGTTQIVNAGGGALGDTTLLAALGLTAFPTNCRGADIQNLGPAPLYIENDGTAADATVTKVDIGQTYRVRNSAQLLTVLHLYCPATAGGYDIRVALWS